MGAVKYCYPYAGEDEDSFIIDHEAVRIPLYLGSISIISSE